MPFSQAKVRRGGIACAPNGRASERVPVGRSGAHRPREGDEPLPAVRYSFSPKYSEETGKLTPAEFLIALQGAIPEISPGDVDVVWGAACQLIEEALRGGHAVGIPHVLVIEPYMRRSTFTRLPGDSKARKVPPKPWLRLRINRAFAPTMRMTRLSRTAHTGRVVTQ